MNAGIGSYVLDLTAGRWRSSAGLDVIFGIDAAFERSIDGWASLIHPVDRPSMVAYFTEEVVRGGQPFDRTYRIIRRSDGVERWVHGRGRLELDGEGRPIRMLGTIADVTSAHEAEAALRESELRYAAIFDGTHEAILIAEIATRRLRWMNAAACVLLGYDRATLTAMTVDALHPPSDLPWILEAFTALHEGRITIARSVPCRRADGSTIVVDIRGSLAEIDGVPCNIGFFTDVTEQRRLEDHDRKLARAVEQTNEAVMITGPAGQIEYVNPAFERLTGAAAAELVGSHPSRLGSPQAAAVFRSMWLAIADGSSWTGDLVHRGVDGSDRLAEAVVSPVHDDQGALAGFVAIERDVTDERSLARERERLVAAVEQTSDSIVITRVDGTIEYVNQAFERISGYRRDEVVGSSHVELRGAGHSIEFHRGLRTHLNRGQPWSGTLVGRHKDGGTYEEMATISPIRGARGQIRGYVAVRRDVTALRAAESALEREIRERAEVVLALSALPTGVTAEETAGTICDSLLALDGVDSALLITFVDERRAVPLGLAGPAGLPLAIGRPLPGARAQYLRERASQGPWAETWRPRPADGRYGAAMAAAGIVAVAYAPIRSDGVVLGVVAVASMEHGSASRLSRHLPTVSEYAAAAGVRLGTQLQQSRDVDRVRARVRRALRPGGLATIFEPIVDLTTGVPVGFEALTRFADGTRPDELIGDAHSIGIGVSVEIACLRAALRASGALPAECWVSINLSPDALLGEQDLAALLADHDRPIVIELTEHAQVEDYEAIRRAMRTLGPGASLAVDDAGAGFASLRHVVELRPRYLKLDASLIRHADRDPARQAMIAGMQQFAARIGCQVLAEGIELPAELDALRELGVPLGQGFLLTTAAGRGDAPSARKPGPVPRRRAARSGSSCRRTVTGTESRPRNGSSRSA